MGAAALAMAVVGTVPVALAAAVPGRVVLVTADHAEGTTADIAVGQSSVPEIAPGGSGCIPATFSSDKSVNAPSATYTFTAPAGTRFVPGQSIDWWYGSKKYTGTITTYTVSPDGTTLTFNDNPALWINWNGHGPEEHDSPLTYCLPVTVNVDTKPGLATGGTAKVDDSPTGSLSVLVPDTSSPSPSPSSSPSPSPTASSSPTTSPTPAPSTSPVPTTSTTPRPAPSDTDSGELAHTGSQDRTGTLLGAAAALTAAGTAAVVLARRHRRH